MTHHHHHHHDDKDHHHHASKPGGALRFEEKLERLLTHWVDHNGDHANTYREWAAQAESKGMSEAARRLNKAADLTDEISRQFEAARELIL